MDSLDPGVAEIYDISLPLGASTAVWPGDTPFEFALSWKRSEGASVNLGAITMSVHFGTHVDAPFHFSDEGERIGSLPLSVFWGPALVIDVTDARETGAIEPEAFAGVDVRATPRILLKTNVWRDHTRFPDTIPVLSLDSVAWLRDNGVVLLGIDLPSVDRIDSSDLPNHHALADAGIHILESIDLRIVPPGTYELSALPLCLNDADGAPVRAVLRRGGA